MILKLLSFNVRGLNYPSAVRLLKHYIESILRLDILFLQEHKLKRQQYNDLGRYLWNSTRTWSFEASQGYNNGASDLGVGCGGISVLLVARWSKLITHLASVLNNQAQFIVIRGLSSGDIGFFNVYASNELTERVQLWEEFMNTLPQKCKWIMAGNFNFVEYRHNKMNVYSRLIPLGELLVFGALKLFLNIEEPNRSRDSQHFFWDNFQSDGCRILARLDKCYIFSNSVTGNWNVVSYKIRGDTGWSDHLPIKNSIQLEAGHSRPSQLHMSVNNMDDIMPQLIDLWGQQRLGIPFFTKIRTLTRFYRSHCK